MYGKIFADIFDSSLIAVGGWLPTYTMMSMVALADKDGLVQVAPLALYRKLSLADGAIEITFEQFTKALTYLESPDPESRSPAQEGKRIIPLSQVDEIEGNRGWLIVNYERHLKKASKSEPRGASTARVQRYRERQKEAENDIQRNQSLSENETGCNGDETRGNGHIDVDVDVDKKIKDSREFQFAHSMFDKIKDQYPKSKAPNFTKWADTIRLTIERDKRSVEDLWELFIWANDDEFWSANILSPESLRKQFDKLYAQQARAHHKIKNKIVTPIWEREGFDTESEWNAEQDRNHQIKIARILQGEGKPLTPGLQKLMDEENDIQAPAQRALAVSGSSGEPS